jgi:hypothetical protein
MPHSIRMLIFPDNNRLARSNHSTLLAILVCKQLTCEIRHRSAIVLYCTSQEDRGVSFFQSNRFSSCRCSRRPNRREPENRSDPFTNGRRTRCSGSVDDRFDVFRFSTLHNICKSSYMMILRASVSYISTTRFFRVLVCPFYNKKRGVYVAEFFFVLG